MYCDLPQLKRCCFCLPLRPGLIAWGYIKTVVLQKLGCLPFSGHYYMVVVCKQMAVLVFTVLLLIVMAENFESLSYGRYRPDITNIIMQFLLLIVMLVDIGFSITFIVSGHKKNTELMKKCLYYHVFIFVISNIIFIVVVAYIGYGTGLWYFFFVEVLLVFIAVGVLNAVLQFYVILLIKSEIQKLNSECYFRFQNNETAAQCHMTIGKLNIGSVGTPQKQDKLELIKEEVPPGKV